MSVSKYVELDIYRFIQELAEREEAQELEVYGEKINIDAVELETLTVLLLLLAFTNFV